MSVICLHLDPLQFFKRLSHERHVCFLTGSGAEHWDTIIAFDPAEVFIANSRDVNGFLSFVARSRALGRKLIGYLSYEVGCFLHQVSVQAVDDLQLPGIFFCAFDNYLVFHGSSARVYYNDPEFPDRVAAIRRRAVKPLQQGSQCFFIPEISRRCYRAAFQKIKTHIYKGDIYQVNLSHRLTARSTSSAPALFISLCRKNPVGFLAFLDCGDFQVLSGSPERFVTIQDGVINTFPIKGTRPYAGKAKCQREELVRDFKEQAELHMITDLLRNDVGKVCAPGSVRVVRSRVVRRCAAVWHAYSVVRGRLDYGIDSVQALLSMLPGGSISGCPKKRAIEIIDELEPTARGIYTGVIGTINLHGNLDFNIAIRTIIKRGNKLWLQVGGGIVYASQEEQEYQETLAKAASFQGL
ncbi:MAG: anthranilate synthase component I family protein [Desulfobacterota bacterium]|nr:anthranilate synthase component I family protein [Thermodesulfobacteriota bacterium]